MKEEDEIREEGGRGKYKRGGKGKRRKSEDKKSW